MIYLSLEFVVEYPIQSFSSFETVWSASQNKALPNHGANLDSHDVRLVFMTVNTQKRVVKHTRWKKFRFERKLWTLSLLTGMNRLQEKRNVSLISVCMGSIAIERGRSVTPPWPRPPGRISWFSLGKRTLWRQKSNHIFCWQGETVCRKRNIIWYPLARILVAAKPCENLLWAQRNKI